MKPGIAPTIVLLFLAGCGSSAPKPSATDTSLGDAVEAAARPSPDPMAATSDAPMPSATNGGAATQ